MQIRKNSEGSQEIKKEGAFLSPGFLGSLDASSVFFPVCVHWR
jgi:hypothetical protein